MLSFPEEDERFCLISSGVVNCHIRITDNFEGVLLHHHSRVFINANAKQLQMCFYKPGQVKLPITTQDMLVNGFAFEIKKDRFKPEYTGQLHFYLNVLDDKIKLPDELPSIGIILCKEKQDAIVQYFIRNMNTPMGVATFMNSNEPPAEIQQVLPDSDQLRRLI